MNTLLISLNFALLLNHASLSPWIRWPFIEGTLWESFLSSCLWGFIILKLNTSLFLIKYSYNWGPRVFCCFFVGFPPPPPVCTSRDFPPLWKLCPSRNFQVGFSGPLSLFTMSRCCYYSSHLNFNNLSHGMHSDFSYYIFPPMFQLFLIKVFCILGTFDTLSVCLFFFS